MTDSVAGQHPTDHLDAEVLADAAENLLSPAEADRVELHLQQCAQCTELAQSLRETTALLRDLPAPAMPEAVAARLRETVRRESQRRASGAAEAEEAAGIAEAAKQTDLGSFRHNPVMDKNGSPTLGQLVGRHHARRPHRGQ